MTWLMAIAVHTHLTCTSFDTFTNRLLAMRPETPFQFDVGSNRAGMYLYSLVMLVVKNASSVFYITNIIVYVKIRFKSQHLGNWG